MLGHDRLSNGERLITRKEARALLRSGRYQSSTGSPYEASHFRRPLVDGSCLHLVIDGRRIRLHHDSFDPHSSMSSLFMHLTHEAKSEAMSYCAMSWSLIKLLAR